MTRSLKQTLPVTFAGNDLLLDARGAIFWPSEHTLIVSDLHLEKASFLAQFGAAVPQYDSRDTLQKLQELVAHHRPQRVICLGDSFHDVKAVRRLSADDAALLNGIVASCAEWVWILGNHDPVLDADIPGIAAAHLDIGGIRLCHEPQPDTPNQIIGHYHPKVQMRLQGTRISGRCFLLGESMLIMPAFGSFTGGLDCNDAALNRLSSTPFSRYLLYRQNIWKV